MKNTFLGTGNAWPLNEIASGNPYTKARLEAITEAEARGQRPRDKRYRTSLYVETQDQCILIDCGPDFRQQREEFGVRQIDALLFSHAHFDHCLGVFDLEVYRRAYPAHFKPIPTWAHPECWPVLKDTLKYTVSAPGSAPGSRLMEGREIRPGVPVTLGATTIESFRTYHGAHAPGACGYVIADGRARFAYTGDLQSVTENEAALSAVAPDVLCLEVNWFNEPANNPYGHMSLQNAIPLLEKWRPRSVYFVHFGDEDLDPWFAPAVPLMDSSGKPHAIPKTHAEWDAAVRQVFGANPRLAGYCRQSDIIAYDGLTLVI